MFEGPKLANFETALANNQIEYIDESVIEKYYETDGAGGCVHIITDDGNYGKGCAQHCLDYAIEQKDYWGEHIARLLLEFNEEEQEQIVERSWEIYEQMFS